MRINEVKDKIDKLGQKYDKNFMIEEDKYPNGQSYIAIYVGYPGCGYKIASIDLETRYGFSAIGISFYKLPGKLQEELFEILVEFARTPEDEREEEKRLKLEFKELQEKVLEWADEKDLLHEENADKQFMKFIEEVFEVKSEMDIWKLYKKFKHDENIEKDFSIEEVERWNNLKLEMGDIFVTLIILCKQLDINPMYCLESAYNKIKGRKGKTIDGQFIKEEDLN